MAEIQNRHRKAARRAMDDQLLGHVQDVTRNWCREFAAQVLADQEAEFSEWLDRLASEHKSPARDALVRASTRVRSGEWRGDG